jgi:hypothetical protein
MLFLALLSLVGLVVPYLGFIGVIPLLKGRRLGAVGVLFAVAWLLLPSRPVVLGACPRLYSFDGNGWALDADLLASSLFPWAERREMARLENGRVIDGEVRLRLQNDRDEIDHINGVSLTVVDHVGDVEILPTLRGEPVAIKDARPPIHGSEFAHPGGKQGLLVLHGRSSELAEQALFRYLTKFGQPIGPLMAHAVLKAGCICAEEVLDEELERLDLPLMVFVGDRRYQIDPIGPARARSFVVPVELPPGARVTVRLESTPRFWEIDDIRLAPVTEGALEVRTLDDARKHTLRRGESVDLRFAVPPPPSGKRTLLASVRGWYQVPIGGKPLLNLAAVAAHRAGLMSLRDFAAELP